MSAAVAEMNWFELGCAVLLVAGVLAALLAQVPLPRPLRGRRESTQ